MHPIMYREFECLLSSINPRGRVLEVGAIPSKESLLAASPLSQVETKIGLNLNEPSEFQDFKIIQGNANEMTMFEDKSFDLVLCNAVLEHDKFFWMTVEEINRVTKTGGTILIGVPGYTFYSIEKIKRMATAIPGLRNLRQFRAFAPFFTSTLTFEVHDAPGDFYRFSEQTMRDVILKCCSHVKIKSLMCPPRIIGMGTKI